MLAFIRTAVLVAALAAVPAAAMAGEVVDRIVAVVNGEIITLFELNTNLKPFLEQFKGHTLTDEDKASIAKVRTQLLDSMIEDELMDQEVKKYGITVSDTEVENELESTIKRSKLSREDFEEQLKLEGMTVGEFKKRIGKDILKHRLLGAMVKRKVVVSEEEVREYYDAHTQDYVQDKKVGLSVILAPSVASAQDIRDRIEKGELTFADAAGLYSQGPGADQGGSLGEVAWADIDSAWRDALAGVEAGGVSQSFEFRGFGALLSLDSVDGGGAKPFEEVADEIRNMLYQKQMQERFKQYMAELRSNALVDIKL